VLCCVVLCCVVLCCVVLGCVSPFFSCASQRDALFKNYTSQLGLHCSFRALSITNSNHSVQ
jgi:hypothetical protein